MWVLLYRFLAQWADKRAETALRQARCASPKDQPQFQHRYEKAKADSKAYHALARR